MDHSALKFLMTKKNANLRFLCWVLLLQEFDFEMQDRKGSENVVADHLFQLPTFPYDSFPMRDASVKDTLMMALVVGKTPWSIDITNYLACGELTEFESRAMKKSFFRKVGNFF